MKEKKVRKKSEKGGKRNMMPLPLPVKEEKKFFPPSIEEEKKKLRKV